MATVRVTIEGLDGARMALNNLALAIEKPDDKLLTRLGDAMLEDTDIRFMSRGYGSWPPLKPATIKRKGHANVLIDSGAMMASTEISKHGNEVILTVPHGGKNRSTAVPGYHQTGTRTMPQRKVVDVTPQLMVRLGEAMAKWVSDLIAAFGKDMGE